MTESNRPAPRKDQEEFAEEQASLLKITFGPLIWATHFVVCYGLVAVTCAKGWDFFLIRIVLLVLSVGALAGVGLIGRTAWRQWNARETGDFVNRGGHAEDRHHFLGHAAFLLAIISFIGVIFVTLPLLMIGGCR